MTYCNVGLQLILVNFLRFQNSKNIKVKASITMNAHILKKLYLDLFTGIPENLQSYEGSIHDEAHL